MLSDEDDDSSDDKVETEIRTSKEKGANKAAIKNVLGDFIKFLAEDNKKAKESWKAEITKHFALADELRSQVDSVQLPEPAAQSAAKPVNPPHAILTNFHFEQKKANKAILPTTKNLPASNKVRRNSF